MWKPEVNCGRVATCPFLFSHIDEDKQSDVCAERGYNAIGRWNPTRVKENEERKKNQER